MKKLTLLTFATLALSTVTAHADTKNLYKQGYDTETDITNTWSSAFAATGLSLPSDETGKYVKFSNPGSGPRTCYTNWGDVYGEDITNYTLSFDFYLNTDASYNGYQICLYTINEAKPGGAGNAQFVPDYSIFNLVQEATNGSTTFYVNGDTNVGKTITFDTWLTMSISVNGSNVTWSISAQEDQIATGEYTLTGETKIGGISICAPRGGGFSLDGVLLTTEIDGDWANAPSVTLSSLFQTSRTYTIDFSDNGNNYLFYKVPGATEFTSINYYEVDNTDGKLDLTVENSGILECYVVKGNATSSTVSVDVDCSLINLPQATINTVGVGAGYQKTYQISNSASDVLLNPSIFLDVVYETESGETITKNDFTIGDKFTVNEKGKLTVTTKSMRIDDDYAYAPSKTTLVNDNAYKLDTTINFATMTDDDITAKGFTFVDDLSSATTSGENNWTARQRIYYYYINGTDTTLVKPFGFNSASVDAYFLRRYTMSADDLATGKDSTTFAPLYTWRNMEMHFLRGVGIIGAATSANNLTLGLQGYTENDFYQVYKVGGYGSDTKHPYITANSEEEATAQFIADGYESTTEVYRGNETFLLYRIDTALQRVDIYKPETNPAAIESLNSETLQDGIIYTLQGTPVSDATAPGIYVVNGQIIMMK